VKRILSMVAVAALGLCLLTACGDDKGDGAGGSSKDYCADLKSTKKEFDALKGGDYSTLQKTTDAMKRLSGEAPDEIKDDWATLLDGFEKIVAALKKAGLSDSDMAALQSGQVPDGVDMDALTGLMNEIKSLQSDAFLKAVDDINKHAKDKCGVDLQA